MFARKTVVSVLLIITCALAGRADEADSPKWVSAMKKVREGFKGTPGYVAQFGDSITYTMAFWKPMSWSDPDQYLKDDGLPKHPDKPWKQIIKGAGDEGKGADAANYSGW